MRKCGRRSRSTALVCRTCAVFSDWPCGPTAARVFFGGHSSTSIMAASSAGGHRWCRPVRDRGRTHVLALFGALTFKAEHDRKLGMTSNVTSSNFVWLPPPWYPDFLASRTLAFFFHLLLLLILRPSRRLCRATYRCLAGNIKRKSKRSKTTTTATTTRSDTLSITTNKKETPLIKKEKKKTKTKTKTNEDEKIKLEVPYVLPKALLTHLTRKPDARHDVDSNSCSHNRLTKNAAFVPVTTIAATPVFTM